MPEVMIKGCKCNRCNHEWSPNKVTGLINKTPIVCPKCKSPYWDRPRLWIKTKEEKNA